jgi:hypothetical protein
MPELITRSAASGGRATASVSSVRVSTKSAEPSVARLQAMGSIIPTGAPTKADSARWARRATVRPSIATPCSAASARSVATSSAALDERPLPSGTSERTRASKPRSAKPASRSAQVTPCT